MISEQSVQGPRGRGDPEADRYIANALAGIAANDQVCWLRAAVDLLRREGDDPEQPSRRGLAGCKLDEDQDGLTWAQEWLAGSDAPPAWLDDDRLAAGQRFFDEWSLPISICLFCASLPKAYSAQPGVQVLARMSQLNQSGNVGTRVANTGRMLLDITAPGGLDADGPGRRRLRRVRLLHATSRALVATDAEPGSWPTEWGVPVAQEDQLGTLLSFTITVVDAMRSLGIAVSAQEESDYLYLWSVVGWFLGTEGTERIQTPETARGLQVDLEGRLFERTEEGVGLTSLLLQDMTGTMPRFLAGMPAGLVHHLAGQRVADLLGVPPSPTWVTLLASVARVIRVVTALPGGRSALTFPSRRWGRTLIASSRQERSSSRVRRTPGPISAATRAIHGTR